MGLSKKVLVTGASEGIGRALSLRLAREGYEVTAVARNEARLDELLRKLPHVGHSKIVADLSTSAGVKRVTDELARHPYSIVVNNAGFGGLQKFSEQPLEKIRQMLAVNVSALVEISQAFVKHAREGDTLMNVSSTVSFMPMPAQGVYAATKAFVTSFTESLWYEMKPKGIHVVNLCPGSTLTQFTTRAGGNQADIPASATQSVDDVVEAAYRALAKKSGPTVVSGFMNQVAVFFTRLVPRTTIVRVMGRLRS